MILFEQLRHYLNTPTPDYTEGVELLFRLNKRNGIRESLLLYPSTTKLHRYLDEIYIELKSAPAATAPPPRIAPTVHLPPPPTKELEDLELKRILLFKELSRCHTLMSDLPYDDKYNTQRYEYMQQCVLIDTELFELRNDIEFYKRTGNLPQRKVIARDLTEGQAQLKLKYESERRSRHYHSRCVDKYTKSLAKASSMDDISSINAKLKKHQEKLAEIELEIKRIEALMSQE